ncbi:hypothetical protein J2Y46_000419 [Microbacterium sp. BE35]|uniref:hypothetical protein n=1 Tax=Microbacterium sp. BE35 TaxID=2817773 RepID=UPI0028647CE6|nr:hypothetical protein [Microbacterium sp. BE35]MDR7187603.1 hypothetical protein [Microbacterium sp. BE35]
MDSDRKTIGANHGDIRRVLRSVGRVFGVVLAVAVVGGTLVLCAGALLVGVLADDTGYREPRTAVEWMQAIDRAASALMFAAGALAVALVVTCVIAVAGAFARRTSWSVIGVVCSGLLALAIVGVGVSGQVESLVARAVSAVGNAPAVAPIPSPSPAPDPLTVDDARQEMLAMFSTTIDAAAAPVTTADGSPLIVDAAQLQAAPCGEVGSRLALTTELATADNAASLDAILAAWDAAGYLPDRAMQEDIRYSATLPVERLSIGDTTTIDGLLHVSIQSACAVAGG